MNSANRTPETPPRSNLNLAIARFPHPNQSYRTPKCPHSHLKLTFVSLPHLIRTKWVSLAFIPQWIDLSPEVIDIIDEPIEKTPQPIDIRRQVIDISDAKSSIYPANPLK